MVDCLFTSLLASFISSLLLNPICSVVCYLDLEELTSIQYKIDISDKPLLLEDDDVILSSKHGQKFRCSYHASLDSARESIRLRRDASDDVIDPNAVAQLLKPLEQESCLIHTAHWWTYEFCYMKEIKQYHLEEGKIAGDTIFLGYYVSEFNWNNPEIKSSMEAKMRYHSQQYENGTRCDITGVYRQTQVRFVCESSAQSDYVVRVEEPATCSYIVTVRTPRLCTSRLLAEPDSKSSVPIVCRPVLSEPALKRYGRLENLAAERGKAAMTGDGSVLLKPLSETFGLYLMDDNAAGDDLQLSPATETAEIPTESTKKKKVPTATLR